MDPYYLLVIARTQSLAKRLRGVLEADRILVRWVPSAAQALELDLSPALLILDLPPSGGARSVAWLKRQFNAPLLAIVRPTDPIPDLVDASLARPYRLEQLVELIETTLIDHSPHRIRVANMSLDTETRRLQMNGAVYQLRPIGCQVLALLMARAGNVISRDELFRRVWQTEDGDNTRALDVHIAQLRQQLEADPRHPALIVTERGRGYRLDPPQPTP